MSQLLSGSLRSVFDDRRDVAGAVEVLVRHAAADRPPPLVRHALVDQQLLDHQVVAVEVEVVLGVRRRGLDRLRDLLRGVLRGHREERERIGHLQTGDRVRDQPRLARGAADKSLNGKYFHGHYFTPVVFSVCVPCPRKCRVGANSPSRWPTMFSLMNTGTCLRPSCTAMVCPTMSG